MEKVYRSPDELNGKSMDFALEILNSLPVSDRNEVRRKLSEEYKNLQYLFSEKATPVRPEIKHAITEIREAASEAVDRAKEKVVVVTKDMAQVVDKSAHENPWVFIGATAVSSALIGFLLARKTQAS